MSATTEPNSVKCIVYTNGPTMTAIKHEPLFDRCKISIPDYALIMKDNMDLDNTLLKWNEYIVDNSKSLLIIKRANQDMYCHIKTEWTTTKKRLLVHITLNYRNLFCEYDSDYILSSIESFKVIVNELVKTIEAKFEENHEYTSTPFHELCDEIEMKLYEPNKRQVSPELFNITA